jgi:hypothetical protein
MFLGLSTIQEASSLRLVKSSEVPKIGGSLCPTKLKEEIETRQKVDPFTLKDVVIYTKGLQKCKYENLQERELRPIVYFRTDRVLEAGD